MEELYVKNGGRVTHVSIETYGLNSRESRKTTKCLSHSKKYRLKLYGGDSTNKAKIDVMAR